jgi:hypothetical protein
MNLVTLRIRASGQVGEFLPDVARALLSGGIAEEVRPAAARPREPESAMVRPATERAISQTAPAARPRGRR